MARDLEKSRSDKSIKPQDGADAKPKGGGGVQSYFVRSAKPDTLHGNLTAVQRVFRYADATGWMLNIIAFAAAICAGIMLPLLDIIFGKFVTTFNDYAIGKSTRAAFRSDIRTLRRATFTTCPIAPCSYHP
jgi:ATP-binding cassette subfamily B (MDR/TAP) protein 1